MQSELSLTVLRLSEDEREARVQARLRTRLLEGEHSRRRLRRWLGRRLVRLGTRLAAEPMPSMRSARAR